MCHSDYSFFSEEIHYKLYRSMLLQDHNMDQVAETTRPWPSERANFVGHYKLLPLIFSVSE
jgi:hypothetical protein